LREPTGAWELSRVGRLRELDAREGKHFLHETSSSVSYVPVIHTTPHTGMPPCGRTPRIASRHRRLGQTSAQFILAADSACMSCALPLKRLGGGGGGYGPTASMGPVMHETCGRVVLCPYARLRAMRVHVRVYPCDEVELCFRGQSVAKSFVVNLACAGFGRFGAGQRSRMALISKAALEDGGVSQQRVGPATPALRCSSVSVSIEGPLERRPSLAMESIEAANTMPSAAASGLSLSCR